MEAVARLLFQSDEERRSEAFDRASVDLGYWNPYLPSATPSEARAERAAILRGDFSRQVEPVASRATATQTQPAVRVRGK